MNMTSDWHVLHDLFIRLLGFLTISSSEDSHILRFLPHIPLLWRVSTITNIILSGFQLGLYCAHEQPFAYWYLTQVLETHLGCLDDLLPHLSQDSLSYKELKFQHTFLTAFQSMSLGTALILIKQGKGLKRHSDILDPGFSRRYKWAFRTDQHATRTQDILTPNMMNYIEDCNKIAEEQKTSPSSFWNLAKYLLTTLSESPSPLGWSDMWSKDRLTLLKTLIATCEEYIVLPEDVSHVNITWVSDSNSVFPHRH